MRHGMVLVEGHILEGQAADSYTSGQWHQGRVICNRREGKVGNRKGRAWVTASHLDKCVGQVDSPTTNVILHFFKDCFHLVYVSLLGLIDAFRRLSFLTRVLVCSYCGQECV